MRTISLFPAVLVFAGLASVALSEPQSAPKAANRMEITVEQRAGSSWRRVDPTLVFANDDHIRFRFRANFNGYLYVMNQSTSGSYSQLFPREDTGRANRIVAGQEYMVPATENSSFRVAGPPGHDVVYWMVTPIELASAGSAPLVPSLPTEPAQPVVGMTPRCDDTLFRARGECMDVSAGPQTVTKPEKLPPNLAAVPQSSQRDLVIIKEKGSSVVASPKPLQGPVIYEMHLAHK